MATGRVTPVSFSRKFDWQLVSEGFAGFKDMHTDRMLLKDGHFSSSAVVVFRGQLILRQLFNVTSVAVYE